MLQINLDFYRIIMKIDSCRLIYIVHVLYRIYKLLSCAIM